MLYQEDLCNLDDLILPDLTAVVEDESRDAAYASMESASPPRYPTNEADDDRWSLVSITSSPPFVTDDKEVSSPEVSEERIFMNRPSPSLSMEPTSSSSSPRPYLPAGVCVAEVAHAAQTQPPEDDILDLTDSFPPSLLESTAKKDESQTTQDIFVLVDRISSKTEKSTDQITFKQALLLLILNLLIFIIINSSLSSVSNCCSPSRSVFTMSSARQSSEISTIVEKSVPLRIMHSNVAVFTGLAHRVQRLLVCLLF
jgi:hypothetical protein